MVRTQGVVMKAPEETRRACLWIVDCEKKIIYRQAIMAALGRIEDDDELLAVAKQICELKPKSNEAIAMIHRWKTGKGETGDAVALGGELAQRLDDYKRRYPATTMADMLEALKMVRLAICQADSRALQGMCAVG
ncbi:MAG: hypothetical protein PHR77_04740 [Kiritimatiellae bacterium]|nr:hypothetical protein [Kiritimatiellia bacterium]MDD5519465.1 hypothetical protein [Kiritimatiellia bacterium]